MRLNTKFRISIFAVIFIFAALSFNAQVAPVDTRKLTDYTEGFYTFKTEKGYLFVLNKEKDAYQIEFKGRKLEYIDKHVPWVFKIDDSFLNLLNVLNKNYWGTKSVKTNPTDDELFEAHKIWESEFLSGRYKSKLSVSSEIFNLESGRKVMYWSFPVPKPFDSDFSHRNFLTTLIGKDILALCGAPKSAADEKVVRDYLIETIKTLKVSDKPFNIKQLRLAHKELKPGEDNL